MCVIFSVLAIPCSVIDVSIGGIVASLIRLNFIIMMPILFVRTYGVRNFLAANIEKLDGFNIINECGDEYSRIDIEMVESGLKEGMVRTRKMFILMWIMMAWVMLEVAVFLIAFVAAMFNECTRGIDC